jgi:alpha-beta hydrolase superfamily lysophospholipase
MAEAQGKPATEERTAGSSGLDMFFRSWRPEGAPRAVVVIVHGLNAHSGLYFWTAAQFVAAGLAVYALDLRGRGLSEGERFYVERFADYVSDVSTLVKTAKAREPGLPVFVLGHSAGGVVSSIYVLDNQPEVAGFICESFAFQVPAPDFVLAAIKGLSGIAPRARVLKLKNEDFSRDPAIVAAMNADPLIGNETQPVRTLAELVRANDRLKAVFPRFTLPLFILHGTRDKATRPSGSQFFYDHASSKDKTLKLYEGHFHDLLGDIGREEVMADIVAWIGKRIPA